MGYYFNWNKIHDNLTLSKSCLFTIFTVKYRYEIFISNYSNIQMYTNQYHQITYFCILIIDVKYLLFSLVLQLEVYLKQHFFSANNLATQIYNLSISIWSKIKLDIDQ